VLVVGVVAIADSVAETLGFGSQSRPTHHHVNAAVAIAVPSVPILVGIGVGLLVVRTMMRNPEGRFAPFILGGFPAVNDVWPGATSGVQRPATIQRWRRSNVRPRPERSARRASSLPSSGLPLSAMRSRR